MSKWQAICNFLKYRAPCPLYEQPLYTEHCRPEPEEIVEPIPECCDHCSCIKRGHPCCWCGVWLKDIEPIEVAGNMMTLNPIAMEYERRYGFRLAGRNQPWMYAVRHRDESIEITSDDRCWDSRTLRVNDCRETKGWLSPDLECGITVDPRCEYHRYIWDGE